MWCGVAAVIDLPPVAAVLSQSMAARCSGRRNDAATQMTVAGSVPAAYLRICPRCV
jgi:hypothetical protein